MDDWDDWDDPGFDDDLDLDADDADEEETSDLGWAFEDDEDDEDDGDSWGDVGTGGHDAIGALGADEDADGDLEDAALAASDGDGGAGRGGAGAAGPHTTAVGTGEGGRMSAWEFGTATAVAGWLLDRQADRIVEAVRERAQPPVAEHTGGATAAQAVEPWQRLPVPPLDPGAAPVEVGRALDASALHVTLTRWLATGTDAVLEARDASGAHRLAVLVSPLVPHRPVWVVAEEADGGFTGTRLLPLFTDGGGGRWVCAVDASRPAVAAVVWALQRHGVALSALIRHS